VSVVESFTVETTDGSTSTVSVTVNGTNDIATLTDDSETITESDVAQTVTGQLTLSDADADAATVVADTISGTYGSFSVDTDGAWTYVMADAADGLNAGVSVVESFTVETTDGSTSTVSVTVNGTNDVPTIGGSDSGSVREDVGPGLTGTLTISDADLNQSVFIPQTPVSTSYGTFSINSSGGWTYAIDNSKSAVQALNFGESAVDTINVYSVDNTLKQIQITVYGEYELLAGDSFNNSISGSVNGDQIIGLDGDDTITGGAGNDLIEVMTLLMVEPERAMWLYSAVPGRTTPSPALERQ